MQIMLKLRKAYNAVDFEIFIGPHGVIATNLFVRNDPQQIMHSCYFNFI